MLGKNHMKGSIHSNNRITALINECKFTDTSTMETLKLMLLAHTQLNITRLGIGLDYRTNQHLHTSHF